MPGRRPPTKPTKKLEWRLEIVYEYHPTERHRREHWMYCMVSGATPEECKEQAKKYYESQIRSVGWGKITTLKEIKPLTQVNDPAKRKSNSELSSGRSTSPSKSGKRPRKSVSKKAPSSRASSPSSPSSKAKNSSRTRKKKSA